GDAAVFATRVNQAWSQLRAPEARADYDARLATGEPDVVAPATEPPARRWHDDAPAPPVGRRSRWLAGTALAACAVLVFLVYRNEQRPTPPDTPVGAAEAANAPPHDTPDPHPVGAAEAANDSALQEALARALEPAVDLLQEVREE